LLFIVCFVCVCMCARARASVRACVLVKVIKNKVFIFKIITLTVYDGST